MNSQLLEIRALGNVFTSEKLADNCHFLAPKPQSCHPKEVRPHVLERANDRGDLLWWTAALKTARES